MSSQTKAATGPLNLSKWRNVPRNLMAGGGVLVAIGLIVTASLGRLDQFGYSWLLAFMFFLSLCLGALFLVLLHHLFDAGWSVPIRRFCEHIATILFPWMALLFIPVAVLAKTIYKWMNENPALDHALRSKQPLFTVPKFYLVTVLLFGAWWLLSN